MNSIPFLERFWSKVDKTPGKGPWGDCWTWTGPRFHEFGYGFVYGNITAHRTAWKIENGEIPKGMCVLHECDNPPCCNPRHLKLGPHSENVRDRFERGRSAKGSQHGMARLTEAQVKEIRLRVAAGETQWRIAQDFDVACSTISNLITGPGWRHVETANEGPHRKCPKLTEVQVQEIRFRVAAGEMQCEMARFFNVSKATICRIVNGKGWKHVEG